MSTAISEKPGAAQTAPAMAYSTLEVPMQSQPIICSVPDCNKPVQARGWCSTHYMRWLRNGTLVVSSKSEIAKGNKRALRHGHGALDGKRSPIYISWQAMRERCLNPNHPAYARYGGRGITICDRWESFANFLADMAPRPDGMWLDRRDNDGNYEPSNCRWVTPKESAANRRLPVRKGH